MVIGISGKIKSGKSRVAKTLFKILKKEGRQVKIMEEDSTNSFMLFFHFAPFEIKSNDLNEDQKTTVMSLSGVKKYPMRVKCATLAWHTLTSAIEGKKEDVNTENVD